MKKKIIIIVAAAIVIGAGTIYAIGTGYVQFGAPTQAEIDASVSQAEAEAAQKIIEEMQASSAAQQQASTKLEAQSTPAKPPEGAASSVPPVSASSALASSTASTTEATTAIAFNKATDLTLNIGNTNRRSATTTPAGSPIAYQSSNPIVATVSTNGTVTCLATGKTVITAKSGNATATYNLTVAAVTASTSTPTPEKAAGDNIVGSVDTEALAIEVIALANTERRKTGLAELVVEQGLMDLAQIRANEIVSNYSHNRPDGTTVVDLGYGENCGRKSSPSAQVDSWMDSQGHRTNILLGKYQYTGVGCYFGAKTSAKANRPLT